MLKSGFAPISVVSPHNVGEWSIAAKEKSDLIEHFCSAVEQYFKKYRWQDDPCTDVPWQADYKTRSGHPLIYTVFGDGKEATLVLSAVHADELTPVPIAFRFAKYLRDNPGLYRNKDIKIVVAPLANPDGFLRNTPSRGNANGVDLNRNFLTLDWYENAKPFWQTRRERVAKHFPGYFPNSEIETLFQMKLIDDHSPDKILSVHAPLGFLDYDGPGDRKEVTLTTTERRAKQLVHAIAEKTKNYRVVDYRFYPGSLGNFAGNERHIPTVTLELETTDHLKVEEYWNKFLPGMLQSIHYPFTSYPEEKSGNATPFSVLYSASDEKAI